MKTASVQSVFRTVPTVKSVSLYTVGRHSLIAVFVVAFSVACSSTEQKNVSLPESEVSLLSHAQTYPASRPGVSSDPEQQYLTSVADRWRPAQSEDDRDQDGVVNGLDDCPDTGLHLTVNRNGCGLFDEVLEHVVFASGSLWLVVEAKGQLDILAAKLIAFPESRVLIRAHTDSQGSAESNLELSWRRAETVRQHLQLRGVNTLQLQTAGVGETEPRESNRTSEGRSLNRRVDIVTLAELGNSPQHSAVADVGLKLEGASYSREKLHTVSRTLAALNAAKGTNADVKVKGLSSATPPVTTSGTGLRATTMLPTEKMADTTSLAEDSESIGNATRVLRLKPLPAPGFAPDFPVQGVLPGVGFEAGTSALSASTEQSLQPLLIALLTDETVRLAIMTHTDNAGSVASNEALSIKRAESVIAYLVDGGVSKSRLELEGYGELLPVVQNVTEADKARNRRVEVRVLDSGFND